MNLEIHPEVADDFIIKSTNLENDKQILQFEFKGKKNIAIYKDKNFIVMMAKVNILKMMADLKDNQIAIMIGENSSIIINFDVLHIFKESSHICFLPKMNDNMRINNAKDMDR